MIGAAFAWGLEKIQLSILERSTSTRLQATENWLSLLLVILLSIVGLQAGRMRLYDIQPTQFALATRPDLRAADWIQENTPQSASFVVNSFFAYADSLIVGSDGGWWIPMLANRSNTMPSQYALLNEIPSPPEYSQKVLDLVTLLEEKTLDDSESLSALCNWGVTHIYNGQGQGQVGSRISQLFAPNEMLSTSQYYERIYQRDRVSIFRLNPEVCQP